MGRAQVDEWVLLSSIDRDTSGRAQALSGWERSNNSTDPEDVKRFGARFEVKSER